MIPTATYPLFQLDLNEDTCIGLNLSADNPDLKYINSMEKLDKYVRQKIRQDHRLYALGGYAENRKVYQQFKHFDTQSGHRNIHLGIDFWAEEGTPIFCPRDAKVHSFQFNDNPGDYGATIILEHQKDGQAFYSLYGHLSLRDLENLKPGQRIRAGDRVAHLGAENENGGWPPHLHFQLIYDLQGWSGDYPGVVKESEARDYLANCPNPLSFFGEF